MRTLIALVCITLCSHGVLHAQTIFELEPSQSMLMTGKGPGQDATINPFEGEDCYGIIQNIGERSFSIRIQQQGEIVEELTITKGETKKVTLLKGYELYLDPNPSGRSKAKVSYEKIAKE